MSEQYTIFPALAIEAGGVTSAAIAADVSNHAMPKVAITARLRRICSVALLQVVIVSSLGFTAMQERILRSMQRFHIKAGFYGPRNRSGTEACMGHRRSSRLPPVSLGERRIHW